MITQQRLKQLLHYNPNTGKFKWRKSGSGIKANGDAGSNHCGGYRKLTVDKKTYMEHRLAWLYMTGEWPDTCLTHSNYKRADNTWDNILQSARLYSPRLYKQAYISALNTRIERLVNKRTRAQAELKVIQA